MGRTIGFTTFFKSSAAKDTAPQWSNSSPPLSWTWPSCKQPRTDSFRDEDGHNNLQTMCYKKAEYYYSADSAGDTSDSCFTATSLDEELDSFSITSEEEEEEQVEMVMPRPRHDRFFFEPSTSVSSSILEESSNEGEEFPFEESTVAVVVDSQNPYKDFRASMEEMVTELGLKDLDRLQELVEWYLRANGKKFHGYILEAFVDLLLEFASFDTCPTSSSSFVLQQ